MNDIVTLKMPFKFGRSLFREREVDFVFKIGTLEDACHDFLQCTFKEIKDRNPNDVYMALLYAGYINACQKKYKKPKYNFNHAIFWVENMNKKSQTNFAKAMEDLFGKAKEEFGKGEEEKKKK